MHHHSRDLDTMARAGGYAPSRAAANSLGGTGRGEAQVQLIHALAQAEGCLPVTPGQCAAALNGQVPQSSAEPSPPHASEGASPATPQQPAAAMDGQVSQSSAEPSPLHAAEGASPATPQQPAVASNGQVPLSSSEPTPPHAAEGASPVTPQHPAASPNGQVPRSFAEPAPPTAPAPNPCGAGRGADASGCSERGTASKSSKIGLSKSLSRLRGGIAKKTSKMSDQMTRKTGLELNAISIAQSHVGKVYVT